ncbi:hypothetical protein JCM1840_006791 [Sporobolomyces johnsonii]
MSFDAEASAPYPLGTIVLVVPTTHCPSCVTHITHLLTENESGSSLSLDIDPASVVVSLLDHTVRFRPATSISPRQRLRLIQRVQRELEQAGYSVDVPDDLSKTRTARAPLRWMQSSKSDKLGHDEKRRRHRLVCASCRDADAKSAVSSSSEPTWFQTKIGVTGMVCSSCTQSLSSALLSLSHVDASSVQVSLMNGEAMLQHTGQLSPETLVYAIEDLGFDAEVLETKAVSTTVEAVDSAENNQDQAGLWETTLEVEGMTCSSCSHAIHRALSDDPGIESVDVSVLAGLVVVTHRPSLRTAEAISEKIEDAGFDSRVQGQRQLKSKGMAPARAKSEDPSTERSVEVEISGMFCGNCIDAVNTTLSHLPLLSRTSFTLDRPRLTLRYLPSPTSLPPRTLRSFLATLQSAHPDFTFTPCPPASPAARARALHATEARNWAIRVVLALVFVVPAFVIVVVGQSLLPAHKSFRRFWDTPIWGGADRGMIAMWILATLAQLSVGAVFYRRSFYSIRGAVRTAMRGGSRFRWQSLLTWGSMDLLVALGALVAYVASLAILIMDVRAGAGAKQVDTMGYFEMPIFLIFFISIGRGLESWAKLKTGDAVAALGSLKAETGILVDFQGSVEKTPTRSSSGASSDALASAPLPAFHSSPVPLILLEVGDVVLVPPGSHPPADGVLLHGESIFDESGLTGEARPIKKKPGDDVFTGTTNLTSAVLVRVTATGSESMIDKIIRIVMEAQGKKAPIEKLADALTGIFVPVIVFISVLVLVVWIAIAVSANELDHRTDSGGKIFFGVQFAIASLVIACPCGIGLASPTALAVGSGLAAKHGILAHGGGEAFQAATRIETVVFDKTGTLTTGKVVVTDQASFLEDDADELRAYLWDALAQLEDGSTHPLALAIRDFARARPPRSPDSSLSLSSSEEIPGRGLKGIFDLVVSSAPPEKLAIRVGNEAFMEDASPLGSDAAAALDGWKRDGKSVVLASVRLLSTPSTGSRFANLFERPHIALALAIADAPRPEASGVISALHASGKAVWMLSGDNEITAKAIARQVGIDEENVVAGVLPTEKAEHIRALQTRHSGKGLTLFCADGINDAPGLAVADVSVAMGSGSQVSISAANFVLLNSSLNSLLTLLTLSRKVKRRILFNFAWACAFNLCAIPIAAGVFYPVGVRLPPVYSALAMALSSVSVVLSSLALRLYRPPVM